MKNTIKISSKVSKGRRAVFYDNALSHHIYEKDLKAILKEAENNQWKIDPMKGITIGKSLFHALNGSERKLEASLTLQRHLNFWVLILFNRVNRVKNVIL